MRSAVRRGLTSSSKHLHTPPPLLQAQVTQRPQLTKTTSDSTSTKPQTPLLPKHHSNPYTMQAQHGHSAACCNIPPVQSKGYTGKGKWEQIGGFNTCSSSLILPTLFPTVLNTFSTTQNVRQLTPSLRRNRLPLRQQSHPLHLRYLRQRLSPNHPRCRHSRNVGREE